MTDEASASLIGMTSSAHISSARSSAPVTGSGQSDDLPFDVIAEEWDVGRRVRLWRPVRPQDVEDPFAERGLAGPVWAQVWTSGFVLANMVSHCRLRDARVLEVGCGLGLVSV
ncbi:MAG TPA: hypothetical protein VE127_16375, partial [Solirubrobacteraceae bacterium]|nr:hypothetical protein [Solirubrobacteraceae bacterium]